MIVNDEQRRAMEFIALVNRAGYRPTAREINEWRLRPDQRTARRGKLLEPEVPGTPDRRIRKGPSAYRAMLENLVKLPALDTSFLKDLYLPNTALISSVQSILAATRVPGLFDDEYEVIPGKPGKPAVYAPDKPPEGFLAHLRRLGWIERDARRRYGVTMLGHALLKAEALAESGDDESAVMVLAAEDELAYGQVLGVIAECGDALVVDAYLGTQQLVHILAHTSASRFLIGDKLGAGRVTELSVLINLTPPSGMGVRRELRRASIHDRYVIGEHKVYGLSASLNGISKSMATLIDMPETAARPIRADIEAAWMDGEVLATGLELEDSESVDSVEIGPVVIERGGVFRHDRCGVQHRTSRAAERCRNRR